MAGICSRALNTFSSVPSRKMGAYTSCILPVQGLISPFTKNFAPSMLGRLM